MSESTKAEEWRIERAKRMNSNASAPPSIRSGGEELDIFEIMQRFRSDGSCGHIIKQALTQLADRAASAAGDAQDEGELLLAERIAAALRKANCLAESCYTVAPIVVRRELHTVALRSGPRTDERRAVFDECIAIAKAEAFERRMAYSVVQALEAARDATPTEKPRSDKGKHHRVAGVLQEDVDEAEN